MGEVLQECCRSDFVIVDGPPIFPVADSLVLADLVDGVLFVTDAQSSTQASVAQSRRQIHQVGGRILGGILNRVPTTWSANGYDADHRLAWSARWEPVPEERLGSGRGPRGYRGTREQLSCERVRPASVRIRRWA
jgi:ATPases involved in chromosome partitioning